MADDGDELPGVGPRPARAPVDPARLAEIQPGRVFEHRALTNPSNPGPQFCRVVSCTNGRVAFHEIHRLADGSEREPRIAPWNVPAASFLEFDLRTADTTCRCQPRSRVPLAQATDERNDGSMLATTQEPVRFRFRRSRARPGLQVADVMRGGRVVATVLPTDTGLRLISHDRAWSKPKSSAKQPHGIDAEFAAEAAG